MRQRLVDCIYEYVREDKEHFPNMLYIHPEECIDCGACEPQCPWQAMFEELIYTNPLAPVWTQS